MKVCVVGTGLMGGSLALDLKNKKLASHIVGVNRSFESNQWALDHGLVDQILPLEEAVLGVDLVVLSIPIDILNQMLPRVLDLIEPQTILIDLGSTKEGICKLVENHPKRSSYVATHPICGTENSGPSAAILDLYKDKICILCETSKSNPKAVEKVEKMFKEIGSSLIYMGAKEHDLHIAYVSHLSHVSSFALASAVLDKEKDTQNIFNMAGSGFASTVRLAKSSPQMWVPIFLNNKENLLESIDRFTQELSILRESIEKENQEKLLQYLKNANQIRKFLK
ncbi:MAG: prephenate dehydrogenase [Flavobacteriaceae bacterium]|nr:MAG: prephenate dehydrogenase [Flavobacteriaceae bacterium]